MSETLPRSVDAWRMVTARRSFVGSLPIQGMARLHDLLADDSGMADYTLDFGRDELGTAYLAVHVQAPLSLICQRTLEPFIMPVSLDARLGLIDDESEEPGLPPGYEPLLVTDGRVDMAAVIEDELLLAVPLVPMSPDTDLPAVAQDPRVEAKAEAPRENPFAVLRELKKQ